LSSSTVNSGIFAKVLVDHLFSFEIQEGNGLSSIIFEETHVDENPLQLPITAMPRISKRRRCPPRITPNPLLRDRAAILALLDVWCGRGNIIHYRMKANELYFEYGVR
jgi:hypothetical protein